MFKPSFITLIALATLAIAVPAPTTSPAKASTTPAKASTTPVKASTTIAAGPTLTFPAEFQTVAPAAALPNNPVFAQGANVLPQAINGKLGATILGPQNVEMDRQNPDLLAPPSTDSGSVGNAKWPFSLSHNRLQTGGWARQQNVKTMPLATNLASVNMRLQAGAIRELHWHKTAEWAFILKGNVVITAINADGQSAVDTVEPGDLWFFPAGIPHSLQATDDDPDGAEFILVFDDGNFSEDSTFSVTDWMAHVPMELLAKNFQVDISAFSHIPSKELYMIPSSPPPANQAAVVSPDGKAAMPFTFKWSQVKPTQHPGGTTKMVDTRTFPISTTIGGVLATVEPGAIRELHWHPTQDEWSYFIEGNARIGLFAGVASARTFDYGPGDIGYVPASFGHYVENTGNTTLTFLEILNTDIIQDISLNQFLALTPPDVVQAHLGFDAATIQKLTKSKQTIIG